jgi:hypothetical protein
VRRRLAGGGKAALAMTLDNSGYYRDQTVVLGEEIAAPSQPYGRQAA